LSKQYQEHKCISFHGCVSQGKTSSCVWLDSVMKKENSCKCPC